MQQQRYSRVQHGFGECLTKKGVDKKAFTEAYLCPYYFPVTEQEEQRNTVIEIERNKL